MPSPLKSATSETCQSDPGMPTVFGPEWMKFAVLIWKPLSSQVPVHRRGLPQDAALAVAVEVASANDVPVRGRHPNVGVAGLDVVGGRYLVAIQLPDRQLPAVGEPQDVLRTVAVGIPSPSGCQSGPGVLVTVEPILRKSALIIWLPSSSQTASWPESVRQNMSVLPSPFTSPVSTTCQSGPGIPTALAPSRV